MQVPQGGAPDPAQVQHAIDFTTKKRDLLLDRASTLERLAGVAGEAAQIIIDLAGNHQRDILLEVEEIQRNIDQLTLIQQHLNSSLVIPRDPRRGGIV